MLNPYILLTPALLDAMIRQPRFFVRQYYYRGCAPGTSQIPLLFSHYSQVGIDKERAFRHFELMKDDKYRYVYDTTNPKDLLNLKNASRQPAHYKIFTNLLVQRWQPPKTIRTKVYAYLKEKFQVESMLGKESVRINLQDLFGKLYLRINWKGTSLEVLLDEIENIYEDVL